MKKVLFLLLGLCVTFVMQAQNSTMPKPGPSPTVKIKKPEQFTLPNGLKVMLVENHKLPRVSFNLYLDNPPFAEGAKKGVSTLMGRMLGNGSSNISKEAYNDEIDFMGAEVSFTASGASGKCLSRYAIRVLELVALGVLEPNFTQEAFEKEKAQLKESLKSQEKSVSAIAGRVENILAFGKSHPFGEYVSEQSLNNISLEDIKNNYQEYFVPQHAYLVVIGDIDPKLLKEQIADNFATWTSAAAPNFSYIDPQNVQYQQINFVDMPNAVQSEIGLVNTFTLKMDHPDYFPSIVANQILGGDFNGYFNANLREKHGWTYAAYSSMGHGKYVDKFSANTSVRNAVTDSAVVELIREVNRIRTEKVDPENLKTVKAGYIGRFVMQIEKPQTIAKYALNIETENLPQDFYENYIKNINAVTPEDVQRVANKYLQPEKMRILVTGKGTEVLPALEKLNIPILYFDKYGNPTEKMRVQMPIPAGVTAQTVVDTYLKNIGGAKALGAVKSLMTIASGTIQGAPVELTTKTTNGKLMRELKAMGMSMFKQIVTDKAAFVVQQGQRREISGIEFDEMKRGAMPFPELEFSKRQDLKLTGIETLMEKDVYVLKSGQSTYYYDSKTGLKIGQSVTAEVNGKVVTQRITFSDYREAKGIKIPYQTNLNMGIDILLVTTDVKINEGVSESDFQ